MHHLENWELVLRESFINVIDTEIQNTEILDYDQFFFYFHGKKYQEILRQMEKEKEMLLLEKEV